MLVVVCCLFLGVLLIVVAVCFSLLVCWLVRSFTWLLACLVVGLFVG